MLCVIAQSGCSDTLCRLEGCGGILRAATSLLQDQCRRHHQPTGGKTAVHCYNCILNSNSEKHLMKCLPCCWKCWIVQVKNTLSWTYIYVWLHLYIIFMCICVGLNICVCVCVFMCMCVRRACVRACVRPFVRVSHTTEMERQSHSIRCQPHPFHRNNDGLPASTPIIVSEWSVVSGRDRFTNYLYEHRGVRNHILLVYNRIDTDTHPWTTGWVSFSLNRLGFLLCPDGIVKPSKELIKCVLQG